MKKIISSDTGCSLPKEAGDEWGASREVSDEEIDIDQMLYDQNLDDIEQATAEYIARVITGDENFAIEELGLSSSELSEIIVGFREVLALYGFDLLYPF